MSDHDLPSHRTRRISLTKSQLRTELGAELLSLCESVTTDGKLAPEEAEGLREWLDEADAADLPAASYLREVVERVLADGEITREECGEVYRAVEAVLPPEVRRQAKDARREIEVEERAEAKAARDQERAKAREERLREAPIASANFMVAGVRHDGRGEVIARYANAGDSVLLVRDLGNRYSRFAIAVQLENGNQIGFVPEEDAQYLAPHMDQGAKSVAWMTKILGRGRVPIPVVQTKLYRPDSTVGVESTARASRVLAVDQGRKTAPSTPTIRRGSAIRGWLWIAAFIVILLLLFRSCG